MFFYYLDMGWRSIRKTPVLSALMVLAISIGIGITITSLNIYQVMAFNPAAERSDQLHAVQLWSQGPDTWDDYSTIITYQDAMHLRTGAIPRAQAAMFRTGQAIQSDNPDVLPELRSVRVTDSGFFSLFSVPFLHGGAWTEVVDQQPAYEIVIGKAVSQKYFGKVNSVGEVLYLNRKPYQVVGVIDDWNPSPKYYDPTNGSFNDAESLFVPFSLAPVEEFAVWGNTNGWQFEPMVTYGDRLVSEKSWVLFWADLADEQAREDYRAWIQSYIEQQQEMGRFTDTAKADVQLADVAKWLEVNKVLRKDNKILVALSALFLCVCLVNILGLLLTKFLKRAPEVGVRRAIGASRRQIFAQHMVEVTLIGLLGGALGLLWAWGLLHVLTERFHMDDALTRLDATLWFITPSIAMGAALLAGLYPAWVICRTQPSVYLKSQ
ncbi:ABC transporter permease [Simiduia aestuariiviva]|uniref:Putative ABC transport system permease protein n=1 Tax=Simiduia aestuariiviva TaxID=1510459 RepID=A0A839UNB6_9GAMM|nr:ABC transporter permease [Simiduia aestuariiviva]MBB3169223.1 putative ABC transport system permease protein [Simiduia aestuariiviva]